MSSAQKILVVEDNDFVRMQMVHFLKEEGYETIESTDGEDAIGKMDKSIALAIVDVRMEPVGGFEFIGRVRGLELHTPVILVTGDQNPDLLEKAAKYNVSAVLMKPVQRDRLTKLVLRTIQHQSRISSP